MKVYAFSSVDWAEAESHGLTPDKAVTAIEKGLQATKQFLPSLSSFLNIAVRPNTQGIIPEYGVGARTWDSEFIEIWFDKYVPHGLENTLSSLYRTVFHEGNHAARWNSISEDYRLIEAAIFEGLATAFERNHADYQPLYGIHKKDDRVADWLEEIKAAGTDWSKRDELFFDNSDGRRWAGYKTGTWIVDMAMQKSGKSIIELTTLPADEILKLADLTHRQS